MTPKGEDSEEDEDTEYFDAMEDSTSFITVITEAKDDRWGWGSPPPLPSGLVSLPRLDLGFYLITLLPSPHTNLWRISLSLGLQLNIFAYFLVFLDLKHTKCLHQDFLFKMYLTSCTFF